MTNVLTSWCVFDVMTHFVTSWRTCWRHDKLCDVITVFSFYDTFCDIMTSFLFLMWQTIWRHDVCCTYWCHNDHFDARKVLTRWRILLTSWQTFWLDFCRSDCILSLFREQNITKTCFWCYNELFDVNKWHVLMSWRHRVFLMLKKSKSKLLYCALYIFTYISAWNTIKCNKHKHKGV